MNRFGRSAESFARLGEVSMIGSTLSHFKITAKLGEGGMGEVYLAQDTKLGRQVAIKVLPELVSSDPERLARFEREARVLASLNHPRIAQIYGLEEADGQQLLVMELAEGKTLREVIAQGPIAPTEALPMALQLAEALEAAHEQGIIHRDLKPANIVVDANGNLKVLDFGLAKALDRTMSEAGDGDPSASPLTHLSPFSMSPTLTEQVTQAGVILGTAAYMSPEQARGKPVDRRADIWAFGCLLFEMLSGGSTYGGETVTDILGAIVHKEPEWSELPEEVAPPIRRLLERCLTKDPRRRLQAIGEARLMLEDYLADPQAFERVPVAAVPVPSAAPARRRLLPWIAVGALVALALGASMMLGRPEPQVLRASIAPPEGLVFHLGSFSPVPP